MTRDGGTTTWNYTYNNAGLRTGRTGGGTTYQYVYNGGQLMQMTKDGQAVYFTYDASGTPLTMKVYTETEENGTAVTKCDTYYYVINLQGDVMALVKVTDEGIETAASYSYTAYGVVTATGNADVIALNPLTYRGYVYDTETGLYYLQSRYYDPAIGRFINADGLVSTGQGFTGNNMFAYCLNNPVFFIDDSGYLAYPGEIHNQVVAHIAAENGFFAEQIILYNGGGIGRADLISAIGEVWDVKPCREFHINRGKNQVQKYTNGTWKAFPYIDLMVGTEIPGGSFIYKGSDATYYVTYKYARDGVITYDYVAMQESEKYNYNYDENYSTLFKPTPNLNINIDGKYGVVVTVVVCLLYIAAEYVTQGAFLL